jgi:hypothetical protein
MAEIREQKKKRKRRNKNMKKAPGSPSAQQTEPARGPSTHFPNRYSISLSPSPTTGTRMSASSPPPDFSPSLLAMETAGELLPPHSLRALNVHQNPALSTPSFPLPLLSGSRTGDTVVSVKSLAGASIFRHWNPSISAQW